MLMAKRRIDPEQSHIPRMVTDTAHGNIQLLKVEDDIHQLHILFIPVAVQSSGRNDQYIAGGNIFFAVVGFVGGTPVEHDGDF